MHWQVFFNNELPKKSRFAEFAHFMYLFGVNSSDSKCIW